MPKSAASHANPAIPAPLTRVFIPNLVTVLVSDLIPKLRAKPPSLVNAPLANPFSPPLAAAPAAVCAAPAAALPPNILPNQPPIRLSIPTLPPAAAPPPPLPNILPMIQ